MKTPLISLAVGIFSLFTSFSAYANYTYTFTTQPFDYVYNTTLEGPIAPIDTSNFLKFVITTDELLRSDRQYGTLDILNMGTIEASLGNLTNKLDITDYNSTPQDIRIELTSFNQNGAPDQWNIQLLDGNVAYGQQNLELLSFYTRNYEFQGDSFSQIQAAYSFEPFSYLYAESYSGKWEISQISSPIPENETYALMLAGLGVIGIFERRKGRDSSYLKKALRSKRSYSIRKLPKMI